MKPALTKPAARQTRWLLAVQTATACAACGGSSNNNNTPPGGVTLQVVSFGDSLSDVGTYAPVAAANFGGGRFTTNPGQVWTQNVAKYYGGTLTAANTSGFGIPLSPASGLGYAQGGARVTLQPGGLPHTGYAERRLLTQATTIPINDQVTQFIASYGSFNASQLVLVNGGANDIFYNLTVEQATAAGIQAQLAAGTITPAQAQAAGATAQTAATTAISQAAIDLATVVGRVLQAGATHVVVSTIPDIGGSPQGLASADQGMTFSQVTQLFNGTLKSALQQAWLLSKVIYVDAYTWVDGIQANYQANGFTVSNTGTACNLTAMITAATKLGEPNPTAFGTSLFCSPQTYMVAGADQTYMYADTVHPTTHLHALFSTYLEQQIAASGLGK